MNRLPTALALTVLLAASAPAAASPAGAALYRPQPIVYADEACSRQGCGPEALCEACATLKCVDPASPPPCSADGVCRPKPETFGYYHTRWRRWPTDQKTREPSVAPREEDSLLGPIDPPTAKEEDEQAPPPIEDPADDAEVEAPLEIDFPTAPLPGDGPGLLRGVQPPPAPAEDGPPALPFGQAKPVVPESGPRYRLPSSRAMGLAKKPDRGVRQAGLDGPPALPAALAKARSGSRPVRLPAVNPTDRGAGVVLPAAYNQPKN